ncbi:MAG: hypothetical protein RTU63_06510 [Candidatus Thorarchaeota archaeon]
MNETEFKQIDVLTSSGIALVVTQIFRMLFGGYLIAFDTFYYNDLESASSVFGIYLIIGILTTMFIVGKRKWGLIGLIVLSFFLIIMETIYIGVYISAAVPDPSWHDPFLTSWTLVPHYLFPLLTLIFGYKAYREINPNDARE